MPNIEASRRDLEKLIGKKFSNNELNEALLYAKAEVDSAEGDALVIEVKDSNRPDLWSAEGIAREVRARIGKEKGLPKYGVKKSGLVVKIEKSVKKARPFTVAAIVKGVKVTDELLRQIIHLQEKVDGTFGRKRRESATGIYDYDKIHGNIRYYGADPRKTKFVPLEFKQELDLDEILELHPKGQEYGHLIKGQKVYPIFEDSEKHILSMPPIINSNYSGKVQEDTKNLFIEVSGFDEERIETALNVITLAIAERGGQIYAVKIVDSNGKAKWTPNLAPKKAHAALEDIEKMSGLKLSGKQILDLLARARYKAKIKGKKVEVEYPSYRMDILHPVDVIEDIIISYGYNKIEAAPIQLVTRGGELEEKETENILRELCIGMRLQEILTFTMSSREVQEKKMLLPEQQFVEIANPVSENWSVFRRSLIPEALSFLSKNKGAVYPQNIFEIGKCLELDSSKETKVREPNRLCVALCGRKSSFTEIKSHLDALCKNLGWKHSVAVGNHPGFEKGKVALIRVNEKDGIVGEINKAVRENFGLEMPVSVLEIEL